MAKMAALTGGETLTATVVAPRPPPGPGAVYTLQLVTSAGVDVNKEVAELLPPPPPRGTAVLSRREMGKLTNIFQDWGKVWNFDKRDKVWKVLNLFGERNK